MRFSGGGWGVELLVAPCVPLQRSFENGKTIGETNLIMNFGLETLNCKEMDAYMIK